MEHKDILGFEMRRMSNTISNFIGNELTKAGYDEVTVTHGWILGFLYKHQDSVVFQKDIETRFGMPRSTVANIMKQFEQKDYITRQSDEKDTRLKRVVLTEIGKKVHEDIMKCINHVNELLEDGITEEEKTAFKSLTEKMTENMKKRGFEEEKH